MFIMKCFMAEMPRRCDEWRASLRCFSRAGVESRAALLLFHTEARARELVL